VRIAVITRSDTSTRRTTIPPLTMPPWAPCRRRPRGRSGPAPCIPQIRRDAPGRLPDLRHGAGAARADARRRPEPGAGDMTRRFWVSAVLAVPLLVLTMGADVFGWHLAADADVDLGPARAGDARRAVGAWPFFQRGWASLVDAAPQHVHLDQPRRRRRLLYSLVAALAPGVFPASFRRWAARAGLFRGGRGDHRAGAARPGAGASRPVGDRRRDPRAARPRAEDRSPRAARTATKRMCRWSMSSRATCSACAPARRCRSTVK
jgi:hypothetical protein